MNAKLTDSIRLADLDLAQFEDTVTDADAIARLVAESPSHPLVLGYWGLRGMAGLMGIATCAALAVPRLSDFALEVLAAFPVSAFLPVATLAAAFAFAIAAVALRQVAVVRGHRSPLLPREQKHHLRLVHNKHQLIAARKVRDRLTPAPAAVRVSAR